MPDLDADIHHRAERAADPGAGRAGMTSKEAQSISFCSKFGVGCSSCMHCLQNSQ